MIRDDDNIKIIDCDNSKIILYYNNKIRKYDCIIIRKYDNKKTFGSRRISLGHGLGEIGEVI